MVEDNISTRAAAEPCLLCSNGTITQYQDPTCTVDGYQVCSNCGRTVLPAGHSWGAEYTTESLPTVTKQPTCSSKGEQYYTKYIKQTCSRCGVTKEVSHEVIYEDIPIDPDNHVWGDWFDLSTTEYIDEEPTCTEYGSGHKNINQQRICALNPNHKETRTIREDFNIDPLGHDINYNTYVTEESDWYHHSNPTCTAWGQEKKRTDYFYPCRRCDYKEFYDSTYEFRNSAAPLGHNFVYDSTVAPTVEAEGYDIYKCTRCGEIEHRNFTPKLRPTPYFGKLNDVWRQVVSVWRKINGVWVKMTDHYGKYNGEWRKGNLSHDIPDIDPPVVPSYMLSGTYRFNDVVTMPSEVIEGDINITWKYGENTFESNNMIISDGTLPLVKTTTNHFTPDSMEIGESQEVSKEFYEWFVGNTTEQ